MPKGRPPRPAPPLVACAPPPVTSAALPPRRSYTPTSADCPSSCGSVSSMNSTSHTTARMPTAPATSVGSRNGLAARRARARARATHRTCCAPQAKRASCANHKPAVAANQAHFQCKRSAGACEHRQTRTDRAEPRPSRRLAWTDSQARRRLPVLVRAAAIARAGRLTRARGRTARRTGRWRRRRGSGRRTRRTAPPAARPARAQSPCPC